MCSAGDARRRYGPLPNIMLFADNRSRLERADRDAKEKEDRMKKELKGRDWVWGPDGEVGCTHTSMRYGFMHAGG